jgi:hypothetical protein
MQKQKTKALTLKLVVVKAPANGYRTLQKLRTLAKGITLVVVIER